MIPIEALKETQIGRSVLVVTDVKMHFTDQIGDGWLYVRGFDLCGLKSVAVDIVYLVGDVPPEAALLARERCGASKIGEVRLYPDPQQDFRDHLKRASEIVATWPEWKQNILRDSGKPTRRTPRKPIIPPED